MNTSKKTNKFFLIIFFSILAIIYSKHLRPEIIDKGLAVNSKLSDSLPAFDETSLTRKYLNKHIGVKWKNSLGDWIDANGVPQGNTPWATSTVSRTTSNINIDVTKLVKDQQGKKDQLMVFTATAPVKISSRESEKSPVLRVFLQNGKVLNINPTLDCAISLSTYKNINSKELSFNNTGEKAFIQFPLPSEEILKATLELWPIKIFGSGEIQIYSLNYQSESSQSIEGIASTESSYANLISHPDVVFIDTFDTASIKKEWKDWTGGKRYSSEFIENGYFAGVINPDDNNHSAVNLRYFFGKHYYEEPEEIYFRYSVRFHKDVIYATQGGKLPGQAGTYNTCGWGGRKPDLKCPGWSARMQWYVPIRKGPLKDVVPIGTYLYHLDQTDYYGDVQLWKAYCTLGEWCELEQYVKLNTIGNNDGVLIGYHNGKKVFERTDIQYRAFEKTRIEDIWGLIYHGGTGLPTRPIHIDLDNVVVSKRYIGLLKE